MAKCQTTANRSQSSSCECVSGDDDHNATGDHDCDHEGCHDHGEYDGPRGRHHHHLDNDWSFTLAWWHCDDIDHSCFQHEHHGGPCFLDHNFRAWRQRDHIIATYGDNFDDDSPDTPHHTTH